MAIQISSLTDNNSVDYAAEAGHAISADSATTALNANSIDWSKIANKPNIIPGYYIGKFVIDISLTANEYYFTTDYSTYNVAKSGYTHIGIVRTCFPSGECVINTLQFAGAGDNYIDARITYLPNAIKILSGKTGSAYSTTLNVYVLYFKN